MSCSPKPGRFTDDQVGHKLDLPDPVLAAEVSEADLAPDRIVPTPLSETLYPAVAEATARAAVQSGAARRDPGPGRVAENTRHLRALVARRQSDLAALW